MALQTQQVVTSSFFKPQTAHFTLGSVPSSSLRQQQQHKRQQSQRTTTSSQYFKTNSNVTQRAKNTQKELEHTSNDRMETLHSRLQMEAEKIRKWKNATEVEIKHKEKCLEEANQTIDAQRTSLTELQLKNESLASRLRDEVSNQREIQKKICSTRDMCTALKDHTVKLDQALVQTEEDKASLVQLDTDRKQQFQTLFERFRQLEDGQLEWQRVHKEALLAEKQKSSHVAEQFQQCQQQLEEALGKISGLESKCCGYETSISQLSDELSAKNQDCDVLSKEKADLEHGLSLCNGDISRLENKVDELEKQLHTAEHNVTEKEQELSMAQQTILNNNALHTDQLKTLNSALEAEQTHCKQLEDSENNLKSKLEEVTSQFTDQCKSLSSQLDEAKKQLTLSQQNCSKLEEALSTETKARSELESDKTILEEKLTKLSEEMSELKERMKKEIEEKDTVIRNTQAELAEANMRYEFSQKEWKSSNDVLQEKVSQLEREGKEMTEKVSELNHQLEETNTTLEKERGNTKEQAEKYEKTIDELKNKNAAAVEENSSLKHQIQSLNEKEVCLSAQCSDLDQLKLENASLKESLDLKSTQVVDLNKELSDVQEMLNTKCKELSGQVETYKNEASTARLEHENAKKAFDSQVNDLCATLERYTAENQKTVSQKDKAIESLKQQLQESEVVKRSHENELSACRSKVELLQEEVSAKNNELKELIEAVECLKKNVPSTPVRSTPTVPRPITPAHSTFSTPMENIVVSSTPKAPTCKVPRSASARPSNSLVPSTPSSQSRVYNYRVSSIQVNRNRPAPPCTPRSTSRAKRMCYQEDTEERAKFKELYPDKENDDDEAIFKKPKAKGIAVRKASSTTNTKGLASNTAGVRRPPGNRSGRENKRTVGKKNTGKKSSKDLSWFELDSVYGFGPDD